MGTISRIIAIGFICLLPKYVYAQVTKNECQEQIKDLREIFIVILRKTPAMPPLAQLSPGISSALDEGEKNRDLGNYRACVDETKRIIKIVEGYAK